MIPGTSYFEVPLCIRLNVFVGDGRGGSRGGCFRAVVSECTGSIYPATRYHVVLVMGSKSTYRCELERLRGRRLDVASSTIAIIDPVERINLVAKGGKGAGGRKEGAR